ncbi:hypothetical protein LY90DRAFT_515188 [Neocallimastix californiae]|uniref:Acyltransferase 3 domain-containing protein n=1 Tax=Neocallimastix californiae TaxID=1754190 RepID=A0A1Y2AKM7_9FUNG|nr:hypothetical protein LY90DRAFT_515188 [Neocallimastix californiae]|eukprot:ORY23101.1 hypothetical protein LY90DRAFT_515188 [Neocallimastix californiae]
MYYTILQFQKTRINDEFVSNIQTISRPQEDQKQINILNLNSFVTGSEATLNESLPSLQPKKRKRLYWADCARIFSMLGIILLHSAGYGCEKTHLKRKDSNKEAQDELNTWTSRWHYHFTLEFVGYFVAGYHIVKHVTIKSFKIRVLLYILGLADIFLIFGMTYRLEMKTGRYSKDFRDSYTLTVAFYNVVLFIFFKHEIGRINFSERAIRIISKLSALIFGMYLSHMILKGLLSRYAHINQEEFLGIKLSSSIGCPTFWMVICGSSLLK